jgi:hypothetical protein
MKNITYAVSKEIYTSGDEVRISYGIVAYSNADRDGSKTIVASVRDVTSDKAGLSRLVNDCNNLKLSIVHLNDVVEDFLLQ